MLIIAFSKSNIRYVIDMSLTNPKKEGYVKKIEVPLYGGYFHIHIDQTELLEKKYGLKWISEYDAIAFTRGHHHHVCFESKDITPGIIAHECKHALNDIFRYSGVKLDIDNDETECYLLGWLVNRVQEFINKIVKDHEK